MASTTNFASVDSLSCYVEDRILVPSPTSVVVK